MVVSSIIGFAVSAQFVTVTGVEIPFYVVMLGAGVLKVAALLDADGTEPEEQPVDAEAGPQYEDEAGEFMYSPQETRVP
jgi:hypothetical protein